MNTIREYDIGPQDAALLQRIQEHFVWKSAIDRTAIADLVVDGWHGRLVLCVDEDNRVVAMGVRDLEAS